MASVPARKLQLFDLNFKNFITRRVFDLRFKNFAAPAWGRFFVFQIRIARHAASMTQAELAKAIGITTQWGQSIVAQYERGSRAIPRKRLRLAAEVLGLSLSDLI